MHCTHYTIFLLINHVGFVGPKIHLLHPKFRPKIQSIAGQINHWNSDPPGLVSWECHSYLHQYVNNSRFSTSKCQENCVLNLLWYSNQFRFILYWWKWLFREGIWLSWFVWLLYECVFIPQIHSEIFIVKISKHALLKIYV